MDHNSRTCPRQLALLLSLAIAVLCCRLANAKLIDITLSELVEGSDLIVYGQTAQRGSAESATDTSIVWFEPIAILKGSGLAKTQRLPICNTSNDVEAHDLSKFPGKYIVFAKSGDRCSGPIHGISSVIRVDGGIASTISIVDQPAKQARSTFLKKVRALVDAQSRERR
jgi:hypothetical protein